MHVVVAACGIQCPVNKEVFRFMYSKQSLKLRATFCLSSQAGFWSQVVNDVFPPHIAKALLEGKAVSYPL
jgi:hypothetical protein